MINSQLIYKNASHVMLDLFTVKITNNKFTIDLYKMLKCVGHGKLNFA